MLQWKYAVLSIMTIKLRFCCISLLTVVLFGLNANAQARDILTLAQAERLVLESDPLIARNRANQLALSDQAVAAYAWPDPKLRFGVSNISADTWDFEQENMTQGVIGLSQSFPPAGTVGAKRDQLMALSDSQGHAVDNQVLQSLNKLRSSWLEVYLQYQSEILVKESLDTFSQLKDVTRFQYRSGRGKQHDVVRAQLEEIRMQDRVSDIHMRWESALAQLRKWLGRSNYTENLDMNFPELPEVSTKANISEALEEHPWMLIAKARMTAAKNGVQFADSQHNPGWMLDIKYGYRGKNELEEDRDDLVSAMITMDMPMFTGRKQGKMLRASKSQLRAAQDELDERRRLMLRMLEDSIAKYERNKERVSLFDSALLPQSKQNVEATVNAYQSGVSDFNELVRARLTELDSRLQYLKLKVDQAKAQVSLLYLAGG